MIDKTSDEVSGRYISFLGRVAEIVQSAGMTPFFLVHEGAGDLALAKQVNAGLREPLQTWVAGDALEAKGLIAEKRRRQDVKWMWAMVQDRLQARLRHDPALRARTPKLEAAVAAGGAHAGQPPAVRPTLDARGSDAEQLGDLGAGQ